jgi:hypothetical protein
LNINRKQWCIIIIIAIIDSVIAFHLTANLVDVKIDFLNINPSDKQTEIIKTYDFPPSNPLTGPSLIVGENGTSGLPLFSMSVGLLYDGILAEKVPAYLTAYGAIYPDGSQTIDSISVGVEDASPYSNGGIALSNTAPLLSPEMKQTDVYTQTMISGEVKTLPIVWTAQGDYFAYFYIVFKNGSSPVTYKLQDFKVVVKGQDVVQQDVYNRKTLVATVDGVLLSVINISTAIELVRISDKKKSKKPESPESNADRGQAYYQKQRKKRSTKKKHQSHKN